jgi:hypothetical protein
VGEARLGSQKVGFCLVYRGTNNVMFMSLKIMILSQNPMHHSLKAEAGIAVVRKGNPGLISLPDST